MIVLVYIFKYFLRFIYFFIKLFPIKQNKITFLSRQSNYVSLDYKLLITELQHTKKDLNIVCCIRRLEGNLINKIGYVFFTLNQMYHISTSKVCVVDSYVIPISILKHKKELTIIQTWHSMGAIKKFGYQTLDLEGGSSKKLAYAMNMHGNYDIVLSGSKEMIKYYSKAFNTNPEKFITTNLPRMDYIKKHNVSKEIKNKYPNLKKKKNILYVPTFRKSKICNVDEMLNTIDFKKYNLIVKKHPNDNMTTKDKRVLTLEEYSSMDLLNVADYIITDYSAISIEASILNKPIYLYLYDYKEYCEDFGVNIDLYKEMKKSTFNSFNDIYKNIEQNKYDLNELKKFKDKYTTNSKKTATENIAKIILRGINNEH